MVWKLYKVMVQVLLRCAVAVCFDRTNVSALETQVNKLHRLKRIIACVRQYYSLHPKYAMDTYGTMDNYLKQHISEYEWALLAQLQFVKVSQGTSLHESVLDIA